MTSNDDVDNVAEGDLHGDGVVHNGDGYGDGAVEDSGPTGATVATASIME